MARFGSWVTCGWRNADGGVRNTAKLTIHDGSVVNAEDDNLVDPHLRKSLTSVAGEGVEEGAEGNKRAERTLHVTS